MNKRCNRNPVHCSCSYIGGHCIDDAQANMAGLTQIQPTIHPSICAHYMFIDGSLPKWNILAKEGDEFTAVEENKQTNEFVPSMLLWKTNKQTLVKACAECKQTNGQLSKLTCEAADEQQPVSNPPLYSQYGGGGTQAQTVMSVLTAEFRVGDLGLTLGHVVTDRAE